MQFHSTALPRERCNVWVRIAAMPCFFCWGGGGLVSIRLPKGGGGSCVCVCRVVFPSGDRRRLVSSGLLPLNQLYFIVAGSGSQMTLNWWLGLVEALESGNRWKFATTEPPPQAANYKETEVACACCWL